MMLQETPLTNWNHAIYFDRNKSPNAWDGPEREAGSRPLDQEGQPTSRGPYRGLFSHQASCITDLRIFLFSF